MFNRNWATAALVPMVVALLIDGLIYWVSFTDQMARKDRAMGFAIAVVNSQWLRLNTLNVNIISPLAVTMRGQVTAEDQHRNQCSNLTGQSATCVLTLKPNFVV